jgi:protein-tyrosine phosphatase
MKSRELTWDGCFNARDLGGLPTIGGTDLRWGAIVRSDGLDAVTASGWAAIEAHGVRTIIDLRNDDERNLEALSIRPRSITTLHLPLDVAEDVEFWTPWRSGWQFGTPLYYRPHIERFPERSASVLAAIARAEPGGVLYHCGVGRDRTGMITMLLLALVGGLPHAITSDYSLSRANLTRLYASRGEDDQGPEIDAFLAREGTSAEAVIRSTLEALDLETWRRQGGLSDADVALLRARTLTSFAPRSI